MFGDLPDRQSAQHPYPGRTDRTAKEILNPKHGRRQVVREMYAWLGGRYPGVVLVKAQFNAITPENILLGIRSTPHPVHDFAPTAVHHEDSGVRQKPLRTRFIGAAFDGRSEEHTSELQSRQYLVCRLLLA